MFCPYCGSPNDDNDFRCIKCKRVIQPAAQPVITSDLSASVGMRMLLPVGRSGLAIAAGYAGLFAFLIVPAPLALLLGLLAIRDVRRNPSRPEQFTSRASVTALRTLRDPLVTVWPAFTEALYLLGTSWRGQKALWSRVETGALTLAPLDEGDAPRMRELMEKYRDLPMDLADAALVRVAEREDLTRVFTLDRRHFSVYRPGRRRRFSILPE